MLISKRRITGLNTSSIITTNSTVIGTIVIYLMTLILRESFHPKMNSSTRLRSSLLLWGNFRNISKKMKLTSTLIHRLLVILNWMVHIGKLASNCSTLIGPMVILIVIKEIHPQTEMVAIFFIGISISWRVAIEPETALEAFQVFRTLRINFSISKYMEKPFRDEITSLVVRWIQPQGD